MVGAALLLMTASWSAPAVDLAPPRGRSPEQARRRAESVSVWTPADVAAWSGEGLRGARVTGIALDGTDLWVGTESGGVSVWDGEDWEHLDRRGVLGSEHIAGLARREDELWVALGERLVRWSPSGRTVLSAETALSLGAPVLADGRLAAPSPFSPDTRAAVPREGGWWLALDGRGVVARIDGVDEPFWAPEGAEVLALARFEDGMLAAAGAQGLWRLSPDGVVPIDAGWGLPGSEVTVVAAGATGDRAWVGTDAGVGHVLPSGRVRALDLAPLPAGATAIDAAVSGTNLLVAGPEGLVWLGTQPPKGWSSFAAAAGTKVTRVATTERRWWAAAGATVWSLDARGELSRWDVAGEVRDLDPAGDALAVLSSAGLQWWSPTSTGSLTPLDRYDEPLALSPARDGTLWLLDAGALYTVSVGTRAVAHAIEGGRDLIATGRDDVWVLTADGLVSANLRSIGPVQAPEGERWTAVAAAPRDVWRATASGKLWGPGLPEEGIDLTRLLPGAVPHTLRPDRHGVWVGTSEGWFRVVIAIVRGS